LLWHFAINIDINVFEMSQTEMNTPTPAPIPLPVVLHVRDTCLCFAAQRAARRLARRFDAALRPLGITNNQFSLMMPLNAPHPMTLSQLSAFLGMDQTTMSAALKALERAGLLRVMADEKDRRIRRPLLTEAGYVVMQKALPLWKTEHAKVDEELAGHGPEIRRALKTLNQPPEKKE
jgi:DNA-binding MarR family transcriptional regulator